MPLTFVCIYEVLYCILLKQHMKNYTTDLKSFSNRFFSLHYSSLGTRPICKLTVFTVWAACSSGLFPIGTHFHQVKAAQANHSSLSDIDMEQVQTMTDRGPSYLFSLKNLSGNPSCVHCPCLKTLTHVQSLLYLSFIKRYGMHHTSFKNKQTSKKK